MEFIRKHRLVAHPQHGPKSVRSLEVSLWSGSRIMLRYAAEPAGALLLPDHGFGRVDGLWRRTCFELFVKPSGGGAYREFNFAPLGGWNAYSFSDWRKGMTPLEAAEPPHLVDGRLDDRRHLFPGRYELDVVLGGELVPTGGGKLSLTAVIEEEGGTLSYWALAHPPGPPNFHHPACFTATLPLIAAE